VRQLKDELASLTEKNDLDVHVRIMEYEDLRSTMIQRHEFTLL
jgi:hypothetical protein